MQNFDLNNQKHKNFAKNELNLALNRGAKEIGLDAFTNMKLSDQFTWIKRMKQLAGDGVKFWEESVMSDYLHTELSLFLLVKEHSIQGILWILLYPDLQKLDHL